MGNLRTRWLFQHAGVKLLSAALAVLLWMVVAGEETVERGLRIPLELQQFPPGLELQGEPPSLVDVRVRGASTALSQLSAVGTVAVLDLRGARLGRRLFHLTAEQIRVPFGVEVVQITPPTVALVFENSASKLVPVEAAVDGKPAPGFVVGKVTTDPDMVDIIGPDSSVKRASEALTEPVSVAGARETVREIVNVGLLDPALRLKASRSATVVVEIVPAPLEQTVPDLPVLLRNLARNLSAQAMPSTVNVSVRASRDGLAAGGAEAITAYVDLAGRGAGEYTIAVQADASREAGVTRVDPATVQVRIARAKN